MDKCVIWAAMLVFVPALVYAQLSPGPLSTPHSSLEGTLQCVKCHTLGVGRPQLKCSTCHTDIAERVQNNRGYHAQIVDRAKGDTDCARCHAEHAGRDAALIRWPSTQSSFDHTLTGHALEGKHSTLQCNQCHKTDSFLGLQTQCVSCHQDTHKGQLGPNCGSCHTQTSWRAVSNFNHELTRFPLTGLHAKVACERCHTNPAKAQGAAARYKDIPFADCVACHRDPHKGSFKSACRQCHNTTGWQTTRGLISTSFDHGKTRYPLTGRHAPLQCKSCHKSSDFSVRVASARCTDCHADKHRNQFARRDDRGDCIGCHTTSGFTPATFNLAAHALTRYPLTGKHSAIACEKCHQPKGEATNYYPASASCLDCHRDVHQGQFKDKYLDKCESCHRVEGFAPSTFTLVRHRQSRFVLAGAHGAIACVDCHKADVSGKAHRYLFFDMSCTACHNDPHGLASADGKNNCAACHTESSWISVRPFDHTATRFPLLGGHRTVNCIDCHSPDASKSGKAPSFAETPQACSSCHEDVHAAQFAQVNGGTDCASCHQPARWKPSGFDHNTSAFPLDGRHRAVACISCHKQRTEIRGAAVLIYRNTPKECAQCH
jgi:hypothetical protein